MTEPILRVRDVAKTYQLRGTALRTGHENVRALDGVSFDVREGQTLCVVGESGSGKSTLARLLMRLESPTSGTVRLRDRDLADLNRRELREMRRTVQIVLQDPYGSLNPRRTAGQIIGEAWEIQPGLVPRADRPARLERLMLEVGLDPSMRDRYPHAFSGGQRQRISIARALAVSPQVLILDEALSALDMSVQAQIANLFVDLQRTRNLTYVFISHDLSIVWHLADWIIVMRAGKVVEAGPPDEVFLRPQQPYTRTLIESVPSPRATKGQPS